MTERLKSRDLKALAALTRVREQAALAELATVSMRIHRVEARISALRQDRGEPEGPEGARFFELWLSWRTEAIKREMSRLANLRSEQRQVAVRCGRMVAENAVVDRLLARSIAGERAARERRVQATFPAERYR